VAPLVILAVSAFGPRDRNLQRRSDAARVGLARMAVASGVIAVIVALLFARSELATHSVARLQPLRIFQLVYVVMILVVGATLAERFLRRSAMRWVVAFSLLAGVMVFVERQTYPESARLELFGMIAQSEPENAWEQAFVWISTNTPKDAVFALDSHYINLRGEDAQGFRAIAERSVLPDYSKDGGVVANKPALTEEWMQGLAAQQDINTETDATRIGALRSLGDYANAVVKVCRLP